MKVYQYDTKARYVASAFHEYSELSEFVTCRCYYLCYSFFRAAPNANNFFLSKNHQHSQFIT